MKILDRISLQALDAYTIEHEPIESIDLMERAASSFFEELKNLYDLRNYNFLVFCGPGNNGGDGLAVSRMLSGIAKSIEVFLPGEIDKCSKDFKINLRRIQTIKSIRIHNFIDIHIGDILNKGQCLIIDALFGTGLTRPVGGDFKPVIAHINSFPHPKISIDIPSGLACDSLLEGICVHAEHTISFHSSKLSFYLPEHSDFTGKVHICPIGLNDEFYNSLPGKYYSIEPSFIRKLIRPLKQNIHKYDVGHAFLAAGRKSMMGAAVLAAKACIRSGTGILSVHVPSAGLDILQQTVPEAICYIDQDEICITDISIHQKYNAIGIGPGIGKDQKTIRALTRLLSQVSQETPIVIDADGLNILAEHKELINLLTGRPFILTPHAGEFERLFGKSANSLERLENLSKYAKEIGGIIILKGPKTAVAYSDGRIFFNTSGNPGMATAGSGDALTGMILGFLAQGYPVDQSALLAVYLHGLAGDLAAEKYTEWSMIAGDIIEMIPKSFKCLLSQN